jgi:hypothetical protein
MGEGNYVPKRRYKPLYRRLGFRYIYIYNRPETHHDMSRTGMGGRWWIVGTSEKVGYETSCDFCQMLLAVTVELRPRIIGY